MIRNVLLAAGLLLSLPVLAGEAEIRQALKVKFPNVRIDGVQPAPLAGLYEVRVQTQDGVQIIYTDARANYFIVDGSIVDAKSGRNLTEERMLKLTAVEFGALPTVDRSFINPGQRPVFRLYPDDDENGHP